MTVFDTFDVDDQGEVQMLELSIAMAKAFGLAQEDIMKVRHTAHAQHLMCRARFSSITLTLLQCC